LSFNKGKPIRSINEATIKSDITFESMNEIITRLAGDSEQITFIFGTDA